MALIASDCAVQVEQPSTNIVAQTGATMGDLRQAAADAFGSAPPDARPADPRNQRDGMCADTTGLTISLVPRSGLRLPCARLR